MKSKCYTKLSLSYLEVQQNSKVLTKQIRCEKRKDIFKILDEQLIYFLLFYSDETKDDLNITEI